MAGVDVLFLEITSKQTHILLLTFLRISNFTDYTIISFLQYIILLLITENKFTKQPHRRIINT
jgi:hypothetical protein